MKKLLGVLLTINGDTKKYWSGITVESREQLKTRLQMIFCKSNNISLSDIESNILISNCALYTDADDNIFYIESYNSDGYTVTAYCVNHIDTNTYRKDKSKVFSFYINGDSMYPMSSLKLIRRVGVFKQSLMTVIGCECHV